MIRPERFQKYRLVRYLSARLHRTVFVWFAATIVLTIAITMGLMFLGGRAFEPPHMKRGEQPRNYLAHQFAKVWDQPTARRQLAADIEADFEFGLRLVDAQGRQIEQVGMRCREAWQTIAVAQGAVILGKIELCHPRPAPALPMRLILALLILTALLWAAAGRIARNLTRPLVEVARVARDLGEGKLKSRVDLSARSGAYGHFSHGHGEVAIVGDAINEMASRIEKQLADQRELLAAVSHELRTPLGHMRLLLEIARDKGLPDKTAEEIDLEIGEIDSLVGQLLANSRMDFTALNFTKVDVTQVAIRVLERSGLDPSLLEVETPGLQVLGDETLLSRALANLLDNARKYADGIAALRVEQDGEFVVIKVDDRGPGFADGLEATVFEAFQRGDSGQGLGLGLTLVQRIAKAHNGTAFAQNCPTGTGARVGIRLPLAQLAKS